MVLEERVDVLEEKVTTLQIEFAKQTASNAHTAANLSKMSDVLDRLIESGLLTKPSSEQQLIKLFFTFLAKYYPHIFTFLGALGSFAYYAGVHRLFI